ncbi:hypothetical protein M8371_30635, partial [Klebsiella pneumoniae]|nr:hypothetical protein [Klebsiella pneumoniae]
MKRLPLLAALPLLCASALSAQPLMSVGYFNGGRDVTARPGGEKDKLDSRRIPLCLLTISRPTQH